VPSIRDGRRSAEASRRPEAPAEVEEENSRFEKAYQKGDRTTHRTNLYRTNYNLHGKNTIGIYMVKYYMVSLYRHNLYMHEKSGRLKNRG
jgi:hypothetical protein